MLTLCFWQIDREKPLNALSQWVSPDRLNVCGMVEEPPRVSGQGGRMRLTFPMKAKAIVFFEGNQKKEVSVQGRVWVRIYHTLNVPAYGDYVIVSGVLSEPRAARNPHAFDERRWLESLGVESVLRGYGTKSLSILGKAPESNRLLEFFFYQREKLARKISNLWPEKSAGYFKALITGDRQEINREERDLFIRTGTAHLLAISGLHFTLLTGTFIFLLTLAGVRRQAAAFLGVVFLLVYVFIAGCGVSVRRAGAMAAFGLGAVLMDRPSQSLTVLSFVFCGFIFSDTRVFNNVSFQLSFLSVLFLIVFLNEKGFLLSVPVNVKTTCVASAATFAVGAVVFNGFSLVSIPANLLTVPLFNTALLFAFCALPCSLLPPIGSFMVSAASAFLEAGLLLLSWFAAVPAAYVPVAKPPFGIMAAHLFSGIMVVLGKTKILSLSNKTQTFILGAWIISAGLFFIPTKKIQHAPELILFEARRDLALQVSFGQDQEWFFSSEPKHFKKNYEWIFKPYWKAEGIHALQGVVFLRDVFVKGEARSREIGEIAVKEFWQTAGGLTDPDSRLLGTGGRISFGKERESGFTVLGHAQEKAVLQIHVKGQRVLVLPEPGSDTVLLIRRLRTLVEKSQVIIFNRVRDREVERFFEIIKLVNPEIVLVGKDLPEEQTESFRKKSPIRIFSQESNGGALRLRFENHGIFLQSIRPEFRIDTPG